MEVQAGGLRGQLVGRRSRFAARAHGKSGRYSRFQRPAADLASPAAFLPSAIEPRLLLRGQRAAATSGAANAPPLPARARGRLCCSPCSRPSGTSPPRRRPAAALPAGEKIIAGGLSADGSRMATMATAPDGCWRLRLYDLEAGKPQPRTDLLARKTDAVGCVPTVAAMSRDGGTIAIQAYTRGQGRVLPHRHGRHRARWRSSDRGQEGIRPSGAARHRTVAGRASRRDRCPQL